MKRSALVLVAVIVAGSSLLLVRPADAGRNCLSTLGGDTCITNCVANIQQTCAATPDPSVCAQTVSTQVIILAQLRSTDPLCAPTVAAVRAFCGCP